MLQDSDKVKEIIKRFLTLQHESKSLGEQLQQIHKRQNEIESELSGIENYLYRDRSREFIEDVSVILDKMIEDEETDNYRGSANELKEIIELWLKDYAHYTRYGTDHLASLKKKNR